MADYVSVANLALDKLGEGEIRAPSDDSNAARAIAAVWDQVRRATIRAGKFNFAMTRAELAAQASSSPGYSNPYPYENRFPVPADCLRLVEVIGPESVRRTYRFERRAILADTAGPVFIRYAADVEEMADWDALFVEAFAARLAFQVADRLTGDRGRKADAWNDFRAAIRLAGGADAKEDPPTEHDESSWVEARFA